MKQSAEGVNFERKKDLQPRGAFGVRQQGRFKRIGATLLKESLNDWDLMALAPAGRFCQLRYELDRFGINEYSVFPDLGGLGNHLAYLHTLLPDEEKAHVRRLAGKKLFSDVRRRVGKPLATLVKAGPGKRRGGSS